MDLTINFVLSLINQTPLISYSGTRFGAQMVNSMYSFTHLEIFVPWDSGLAGYNTHSSARSHER